MTSNRRECVGATCLTRVVCAEGWGLVIFDWFILSMRMQVILDSSFRPPGFSPYMGVGMERRVQELD